MNRLLKLILVVVLLIMCSGCFVPGRGWLVPGYGLPGDHDGGGRGDYDGGGYRDSGHGKKH